MTPRVNEGKTAIMLSDSCIRAGWEAERDSMRQFLIKEKKFNPKSVERCIDNFIESAVFAKIPCQSEAGITAAWKRYKFENNIRVTQVS